MCWLSRSFICITAGSLFMTILSGCMGSGSAYLTDVGSVPAVQSKAAPPLHIPNIFTCVGSGASSYVVKGERYWLYPAKEGYIERGLASWYGEPFHGGHTASGDIFDMYQKTAAHKTLPLFSVVEVTNLQNFRKISVLINDRGPFIEKRTIDLSYSAAKELDMLHAGVVPVEIKVLKVPDRQVSG